MTKNNSITQQLICIDSLVYFDVFNHPLNFNEVYKFNKLKIEKQKLQSVINEFVNRKLLKEHNGYYGFGNIEQNVNNRLTYNKQAGIVLSDAKQMGKKIGAFPFVRSVFISGSLSKDVMHPNSDYDYFIIAAENRIWLCKMFLKMYKFFFLKNARDRFCINYFISENNLVIPDKNLFTAVELGTIKQICNCNIDKELYEANRWLNDFLPNLQTNCEVDQTHIRKNILVRSIEFILNGSIGTKLDEKIRKQGILRNKKKYAKLVKNKDYDLMMRSTAKSIKSHENNQQRRVLNLYLQKKKEIELKLNEEGINHK